MISRRIFLRLIGAAPVAAPILAVGEYPAVGAANVALADVDGLLGGFAWISLSNADAAATAPNVRLTGMLTTSRTVTFPLPGFYKVRNDTVGDFDVFVSAGSGNKIWLPRGPTAHIFCDGTDAERIDVSISVPSWIKACESAPWFLV